MDVPARSIHWTKIKILWDFEERTDSIIPTQSPYTVAVNKTTTIIGVAKPNDKNIIRKEKERLWKVILEVKLKEGFWGI